ncbi:MAG: hypothetical protein QOH09_159 [Pseudonocardiales bacterium]|nr:hypothetical protein [Pseudonocardiales bacterium]HZD16062.1 hypothetical protein [Pseudonocardiaceae bacterium]
MVNKPRRRWPWIVGAVLLAVVIGVVVHGGDNSSTSPTTGTAPPAHAPAAPTPGLVARQATRPTGPLTSFGDGTYQVGTAAGDIAAGSYRSAGSTEGMPCYWARTGDLAGKVDTIIAEGYPSGPTTITIKNSDSAFLASGCAPWNKVG